MQGVDHLWVGWVGHVGVGESYRGGVEWVIQGCGGSCRGGLGHAGVGWGGSCRGRVGHAGVGWGGSCRGGVGWNGMGSHLSDCKIMNFCAINF